MFVDATRRDGIVSSKNASRARRLQGFSTDRPTDRPTDRGAFDDPRRDGVTSVNARAGERLVERSIHRARTSHRDARRDR